METNSREIQGLDEGFGEIIFSILRGKLDTITVGIVESYDPGKQSLKVQPAIMRKRLNEDEAKARPIIADVRVIFPGSGEYWQTFPISTGDPVVLLAPSRSLDLWMDSGGVVDPKSTRIFDLSDAIAIPGILDDKNIIPNLTNDGFYIRKKDGSKHLRLNDSGVHVLGNLDVTGALTVSETISATGTIQSTGGDVVAGTISLKNHTHSVTGLPVTNATPTDPTKPVTATGATGAPIGV